MIKHHLRAGVFALAASVAGLGSQQAAAFGSETCDAAPPPVMTLAFGSRYTGESDTRSRIDEESNAAVNAALQPVDDFLRDLTGTANRIYENGTNQQALANCVLTQIATWAEANALADLRKNARLTVGSRLAGFGLVLLQVAPYATDRRALEAIRPWMDARMTDQMIYWEAEAPKGAARNNLRAWAALAGATIGTVFDDPVIRGWSAWSASYVMCTANDDGSLPQEMARGHLALHYQLHAIAPLTVTAAILSRNGFDLTSRCEHALEKVVAFAVNDLKDGSATQRITGVRQSFFDGSDTLEGWQLAWLEAYLTIHFDPKLIALADQYRPLSYSKLGGNQTAIWGQIRW